MQALTDATGVIDDFMYTYILIILLVAAGVYFSIRTGFVQVRRIPDMFRCLLAKADRGQGGDLSEAEGGKGTSSFGALMLSTASRVGTGNIAGVSTAIALGGPGAVLWMWLMCVVGAASAFVESTLAQIWKVRGKDGKFRGGPAYYIQQALGHRWLGVVFAVSLILCYAVGFNGLQAYNMSSSLAYYFNPGDYDGGNAALAATALPAVLGMAFAAFMAFAIFGGQRRISVITSVIVPVMALVYIVFALVVAIWHFADFPAAVGAIFTGSLDGLTGDDGPLTLKSFFGGLTGSAMLLGVKRGLYSNEAGMGSAPNAAATADVSHPVKQGLVQSLSVYIDTLVICSCSAIIVMAYYVDFGTGGFNGMFLVEKAVENLVGPAGVWVLTFAIFTFGLSSLIANYFYAENNLAFITQSTAARTVMRLVALVPAFIGAQLDVVLAWNLADILMGIETAINVVCILLLGRWAFAALSDYDKQRRHGLDPAFVADTVPGMPATECWHPGEVVGGIELSAHTEAGESGVPGAAIGW